MPDVLMFADTFRSPELRHEVPLGIPDPFLYAERNGVKHIQISSMEAQRLSALGLFELHLSEEYGVDELIALGPRVSGDPLRAGVARGQGPRRDERSRAGDIPRCGSPTGCGRRASS